MTSSLNVIRWPSPRVHVSGEHASVPARAPPIPSRPNELSPCPRSLQPRLLTHTLIEHAPIPVGSRRCPVFPSFLCPVTVCPLLCGCVFPNAWFCALARPRPQLMCVWSCAPKCQGGSPAVRPVHWCGCCVAPAALIVSLALVV